MSVYWFVLFLLDQFINILDLLVVVESLKTEDVCTATFKTQSFIVQKPITFNMHKSDLKWNLLAK